MLNALFAALILGAIACGALTGRMGEVNQAALESAKTAAELALGLLGTMTLWLGFMRVLRDAGAMHSIARGLAPLMRRLFPDVPVDHPAMGAMIMNIAANMLGLGNAATPFGLKAMRELNSLNPRPGVATDSMALFLAINTSGVAVLPLGAIAVRASLDSNNAAGILVPSILATFCSTLVAISVARALAKRRRFAFESTALDETEDEDGATLADGIVGLAEAETVATPGVASSPGRSAATAAFVLLIVLALGRHLWTAIPESGAPSALRDILNTWMLPLLMAAIVLVGFSRRVKVYESFIHGAREGFDIVVMIIPFLVGILVAVGMFRASGALDGMTAAIAPITSLIGFPADALPMALIRPLSGSGALGVMTETMTHFGPDSFVGYLVSVMNGSTETTFYVLAVYFGSVRVRATRHTVIACLAADATGVLAALFFCRLFF